MKLQERRIQNKSGKRFLVAIIFLLILITLATVKLLAKADFTKFNIGSLLGIFSQQTVTPLPTVNPISSLTTLLLDKNITVDFPLVATDSAIVAHIKDNGEVLFSSKDNLARQVESLQIILSSLTIEGKKFKKIDLRYTRPIMVY